MSRDSRGRLLVVSHASVLPVNQHVYVRLRDLGWDLTLVVPSRWRHAYAPQPFAATALPELAEELRPLPVRGAGRAQRHVYLARTRRVLAAVAPQVVFVEEECFSLAALQWARTAQKAGVPFGVQAAENLDRPLPKPARFIRSRVLRAAAFVAARSPAAAALALRHGATGRVAVAPHAVPRWHPAAQQRNGRFTIGYAGRLVPEKGLDDLVEAARRVERPARLLLVGDGELRDTLTHQDGLDVEVLTDVEHAEMAAAYGRMDVLVLPSRTTPRWAEQFGRVLVEALSCGVPVVGSDSGEIPWVIDATGGGLVFPEGDRDALAATLRRLRGDSALRARLAAEGRAAVERLFSVDAAAAALDELLVCALAGGGDA